MAKEKKAPGTPGTKRARVAGVDRLIKAFTSVAKHAATHKKILTRWAEKETGASKADVANALVDVTSIVECAAGLLASAKALKDANFVPAVTAGTRTPSVKSFEVGSSAKIKPESVATYPSLTADSVLSVASMGPVRGTVMVQVAGGPLVLVAKQHLQAAA